MVKSWKGLVVVLLLITIWFSTTNLVLARAPGPDPDPNLGLNPPAITNVHHTKTVDSVTVTWSVSFDPHSTHNWMKFYWRPKDGNWVVKKTWDPATSGSKQWTVSELKPGSYQYKIRAWSSSRLGTQSLTKGPYTVAVAIEITNAEESVDGLRVELSWQVTWGTGITGKTVKLYWGEENNLTEENVVQSWTDGRTQYSHTAIVPYFGEYWYKISVQAANSHGTGEVVKGPTKISVGFEGPTTEVLTPVEDCYVLEDYPDQNYNDDALYAGEARFMQHDLQVWSYLKFNLVGIRDVVSAKLRLYVAFIHYSNPHPIKCSAQSNNSWNEYTLTWDTRPSTDGYIEQTLDESCASPGEWQEWDVTAWVQSHENSTVTFVLHSDYGTCPEYPSKDSSSPNKPYLLIEGNYRYDDWDAYERRYWDGTDDIEGIFYPLFILYDPPGNKSYQKVTKGFSASYSVNWYLDTGYGGYQLVVMSGLSEKFRVSQTFQTADFEDWLSDHRFIDSGGDKIYGVKYKQLFHLFGRCRWGYGWNSTVVTDVKIEKETRIGEWSGFRAELDSLPYAGTEVEDLRSVEGPYQWPGKGQTKGLSPCAADEWTLKSTLSRRFYQKRQMGIEVSVSFEVSLGCEMSLGFSAWLKRGSFYEITNADTFEVLIYIENQDRHWGLEYAINSWSEIFRVDSMTLQISDWTYWFTGYYVWYD